MTNVNITANDPQNQASQKPAQPAQQNQQPGVQNPQQGGQPTKEMPAQQK